MDERCSLMFQALADGTRVRILELLKKEEELCVSAIGSHFDMTQPSISHHLDVLKRAGLVKSERRGREVYYSFDRDAMIDCCCAQLRVFDLDIIPMKKGVRLVKRDEKK